jgi:hypothetical protein
VPKAGGASKKLLSTKNPFDVVVDSTYMYWTSTAGNVWKATKKGELPWRISLGQDTPTDMALSGSTVVFTTGETSGDYKVRRVSKVGGTTSTVASGQAYPQDIVASGSTVIWSNYWGDTVMKRAL